MFKGKRIISLAAAVIMTACAVTIPQLMFADVSEGECGEATIWRYDSDSKTLTISGDGEACSKISTGDLPWQSGFADDIVNVVVENGVTELPDNSFSDLTGLTGISIGADVVDIPSGLCKNDAALSNVEIKGEPVSIGDYAFYGCEALTSLDIPQSVTTLGRSIITRTAIEELTITGELSVAGNSFGGAFDSASLKRVILAEGSTKIPAFTFYNATALEKLEFRGDIVEIGENAFAGCSRLRSFDMSEALTSIGRNAFSGTSIREMVINSNLTSAGDVYGSAFAGSVIDKITFSESVTEVPEFVLTYADNFRQVFFMNKDCVIPDDERTIPEGAKIYGCFASTARDYADKYSRGFALICQTGTHSYRRTTVAPTCTEQGYLLNECSICGITYKTSFTDPAGHNAEWIVSIIPTLKNEGLKIFQCSICNQILQRQTLPRLNNPQTTATTTTDNTASTTQSGTGTTRRPASIATLPSHRVTTSGNANILTTTTSVAVSAPGDIRYDNFRVVPGEATLKVSWIKDSRLKGYNIYLSVDGKNFKKIHSTKDNKKDYFVIDKLEYNKVYYVKIAGYVGDNVECRHSLPFVVKTK